MKATIDSARMELRSIMDLKDKKIGNIVVAALYAQKQVDKDLTEYVLPIVEQWFNENKEDVMGSGSHDEVFEEQLKDLVDRILQAYQTPKIDLDVFDDAKYDFTEVDREQLVIDMQFFLLHLNSLSPKLVEGMDACRLDSKYVGDIHERCEREAKELGRFCDYHNNFVLKHTCGMGYTFNSQRECVAECPKHFRKLNDTYCQKPMISSVMNLETGNPGCGSLHRRFGHLCIPSCPIGWADYGSWCRRPRFTPKHYFLVK